MIRRYLREHLPLAGLLALFAGTFALVLSLYHLPTEPVAYASALCAVMGLIALIWGLCALSPGASGACACAECAASSAG